MRWPAQTVLLAASALLTTAADAARPFITDDARLTTEGSCQVESWVRRYTDSREAWALPACNPGGNLEITLGGGRTWPGAAATLLCMVAASGLSATSHPGCPASQGAWPWRR